MPRGHCVISAFYPVERKTHFMDDINGNGLSEGSKRGSIVHRLYRYSPIFFRSPSSTHEKPYFNFSFTRDNGQDLYIKNGEWIISFSLIISPYSLRRKFRELRWRLRGGGGDFITVVVCQFIGLAVTTRQISDCWGKIWFARRSRLTQPWTKNSFVSPLNSLSTNESFIRSSDSAWQMVLPFASANLLH